MTLTVTDTGISSDVSAHTARLVEPTRGGWELSWLPGRLLDRDQVIAGMSIAEGVCDPGLYGPADVVAAGWARLWPLLDSLAAGLGLSGPDAVARATEAPGGSGEES